MEDLKILAETNSDKVVKADSDKVVKTIKLLTVKPKLRLGRAIRCTKPVYAPARCLRMVIVQDI